jgi:cytochrome c oxidase assembly factor CtaG
MKQRRGELPWGQVVWGFVIAGVGFLLPLILNQVLNSNFLHRLHKLLAYLTAFVALTAWVIILRHRALRRSSTK